MCLTDWMVQIAAPNCFRCWLYSHAFHGDVQTAVADVHDVEAGQSRASLGQFDDGHHGRHDLAAHSAKFLRNSQPAHAELGQSRQHRARDMVFPILLLGHFRSGLALDETLDQITQRPDFLILAEIQPSDPRQLCGTFAQ
jgi:hypothetical protein